MATHLFAVAISLLQEEKIMKKRVLAMILAGAMVLSLAACGSASEGASESEGTQATESEGTSASGDSVAGGLTGTLSMGMIGPLTGAAALYGTAVDNACKLAVEEINAISSSFQIEYNGQDDEHDAEKSVNAYNKLKDWGAQVIVGSVTSTPCAAVSSEAYADRMFLLTPSASSTAVTEGNDNVFQLCFSDPNQGSASATYIAENNLATKIAVIYNNSDNYSTGIYQTFMEKAAELNLEVVYEGTFTDDSANDFSVQLTAAKDKGADLLFLPIYYQPASLILTQADAMGYDVAVFGVDGMDGILDYEGFDTSLAEGVMLLTPFAADATDDLTVNFVTSYEAAYGTTPIQFAADGYDCVYAIYDALLFYAEKNGGLDVTDMTYSELCEILISVFTDADFSFDGLTGEGMVWNAAGEVNKDPKAVVIENGVYVGM